jgi:hypothetical protein
MSPSRREFLRRLATGAAVLPLAPFVPGAVGTVFGDSKAFADEKQPGVAPGTEPIEGGPQYPAEPMAKTMHRPGDGRPCANCGVHPKMIGAIVCSPLCAVWEAKSTQGLLGMAEWDRWRTYSEACPWPLVAERMHKAALERSERNTYGVYKLDMGLDTTPCVTSGEKEKSELAQDH